MSVCKILKDKMLQNTNMNMVVHVPLIKLNSTLFIKHFQHHERNQSAVQKVLNKIKT